MTERPKIMLIDGKRFFYVPDEKDGQYKVIPEEDDSNVGASSSGDSRGSSNAGAAECNGDSNGAASSSGSTAGSLNAQSECNGDDEDEDEDDDDNDDDDDDDDDDEVGLEPPSKKGKSSKEKTVRTRASWSEDEVLLLINECIEQCLLQKIDGTIGSNVPQKGLFKSIATSINSSDRVKKKKTWSQCKAKYKGLKKMYFKVVRENSRSGLARKDAQHFDRLTELFKKRPRNFVEAFGCEVSDFANTSVANASTPSDASTQEVSYHSAYSLNCIRLLRRITELKSLKN